MDPVNNRVGHVAVVWQDMTLVFGGARYNGPNASAVKMNYVHLFFCFLYFVFEYGPICNIHYPIKLK